MNKIEKASEEISDIFRKRTLDDVHPGDTSDARIKRHFGDGTDSFHGRLEVDKLTFLYMKWMHGGFDQPSHAMQEPAWHEDPDSAMLRQEIGDIELGKIFDAWKRVEALAGVGDHLKAAASGAKKDLDEVWEGQAASAAMEKFTQLGSGSDDFKESCTKLAAALEGFWRSARHAIEELCKLRDVAAISDFMKIYAADGQLPNGHDEGAPGASRAEWSEVMDHYVTFGSLQEVEDADATHAREWVKCFNEFCGRYANAVHTYRDGVRKAHNAIKKALYDFERAVGDDFDPFAKLAPPKKSEKSGNGRPGNGERSSGDSGPPLNSGPPPGSSGPPPGGISEPGPIGPSLGADTDTPGAGEQPDEGKNPVTGGDLEVDPGTGEAYPIDPETGEAVKDEPDVVNVRKGEKQITLTEPTSSGEMSVEVDDGKGGAKQYRMDFGNSDGDDSKRGEGGAAAGGFGPQGSAAAGAAGKDGAKAGQDEDVYTPDEDGKIRIEDGDVEIVAEQPLGPDGATVVTVDDGEGDPETYLLGDEEAVDEFNRKLGEDELSLMDDRAELEAKGDDASKEEWAELEEREEEFRQRGGALDTDTHSPDSEAGSGGSEDQKSGSAAFADSSIGGDSDGGEASGASSALDGGAAGSGATGSSGGGAAGAGAGGGGAAGGGAAGVGGASSLEGGARSGIGSPGAAGAGAALSGDAGGTSSSSSSGGGGMGGRGGGMGMMPMGAGAGAGAGGGGDEQRTNSAYQAHAGLFEPDIAEGPFGVARISGDLDDDE